MPTFPPETHPFILATALMAVFFIAAMIRLWLLRRVEAKLLKNKDALEKQVADQEREVMEIRKDATEWRAEMKRQFDGFRAACSEQLAAEERRYGELFKRSQDRQVELQTALDIARQMCAELPSTKARVLHLEQMLESAFARGLETHQASARVSAPAPAGERREPQAPEDEGHDLIMPEPSMLTMPVMDEARMAELEERLKATQEQNASLQQALTASRLRSRLKNRPHSTVQSLH